MSMSATRTTTFNTTSARYLTSKISADLRTMNRYYGVPSLSEIDEYAQEAAELMLGGYLRWVDYGLRRPTSPGGKEWVLRLRYIVNSTGALIDDNPGGVPATAPANGATFHSYLSYSDAFNALTPAQQDAFKANLPVKRVGAAEAQLAGGAVNGQRSYSRDGVSLSRNTFVAWAE